MFSCFKFTYSHKVFKKFAIKLQRTYHITKNAGCYSYGKQNQHAPSVIPILPFILKHNTFL